MISQIGSIAISLAGGLIFSSFIFLGLYNKSKNNDYLLVAERAILATCYSIFLAFFCLLNELLISNFNLQYVAQYTSYETPVFFKVTALWAGQAGSLLFWTFISALFTVTYIFTTLNKMKKLKFHSYLILSFIFSFFILLSNFIANPFEPVSSDIIVQNGNGLNPLLQNFFMAIHPPILYVGFTGSAIIFIMALAASISKDISFEWIQSIRRWSLFVWTFLSAGIILGGYWAYNELGWGGYWAWDPVENSSLMPWLTLTAFIHSSMIQEKRGMLKKWNFLLATSTFILVILGTFITRSGVISSVHSFTAENLGPMFFTFLSLLIGFPAAYFISRQSDRVKNILIFLVTIPFWTNLLIRTFAWIIILGKGGVIESSFNFFGLLDDESSLNLMYTNSAILIGLVYSYLPLMVLPIYASMEKMDLRLLEAATDLYSNRIELIRKIILPLSMPGIIGGSILVFVPCLGAFIAPDLLGGGKKLLLGSLIQFQFSYARNWPFGAAMAMFLLALVILVLIFNARLNRKHREYANQK